jgi:hypothetical protein
MATRGEGADKLRLGVVTRDSLRTWRRDFWQLTLLATALEAPIAVVELIWHVDPQIQVTSGAPFFSAFSLPLILYSNLSHHFLSGLLERFVGAERHGHERLTLVELVRDLPWLKLVAADLLLALVTAIGFLLLLVPGFIVATMFAVVLPIVNLERRGVIDSFRRSATLVRGNGGRVFVVWLGTSILSEVVPGLIGQLFHSDSQLVQVLSHAVPAAILLPIAALPLVVMAFELVDRYGRREGHGPTTA